MPWELRLVLSVPAPSTVSLRWQSIKFCGLLTVVASGFFVCFVFALFFRGLPRGRARAVPHLATQVWEYDLSYGGLLVVGCQYFVEMAV